MSAHTPEALAAARDRLAGYLQRKPHVDLDDVSTTLATGREALPQRWAALVHDIPSAVGALRGERAMPVMAVEGFARPDNPPRLVFDFSSEWRKRPARYLYPQRSYKEMDRWLQRASDLLDDRLPVPLLTWLGQQDDGPVSLDDADIAAPAVFAADFALARQLMSWGAEPAVAVGSGIGEFTAESVMGRIEFDDALLRIANWGRMVVEGTVEPDPENFDPETAVREPGAEEGRVTITFGTTLVPDLRASQQALPTVLMRLWCLGTEIDLTTGLSGRRIHLPAYPFQRHLPSASPVEAVPETVRKPTEDGSTPRPMSALEQRLIFLDLVRSSSNVEHTVVAAAELIGPVDATALQDCFAELQREHAVLRRVFSQIGDRWHAVTRPDPLVRLETGRLGDVLELPDYLTEQPFQPADSALVRGMVALGNGTTHLLGLAAHRALVDAALLEKLTYHLAERYCQASALAPAPATEPAEPIDVEEPSCRWRPLAADRLRGAPHAT
ncbi:acyltransferase domain-containing protein [Streptomyces xiangluensis]|uniref:Acyltransferase domain-containing protein n=1 Tax=Streptomyces xiangluensis TaxID=2665720 RepID=A0ABV8YMF5_9ACTN